MMTLLLLLYLFFLSVFLTATFTLIFKNRGPWNNPMLFFILLFMTSWAISLWSGPVSIQGNSHPFLTVSAITLLITVLLSASRTEKRERQRVRGLTDNSVLNVETKTETGQARIIPNVYFWILLTIESLLIIAAYIINKL